MKINRFEDIEAWQLARELASEAYSICRSGELERDYGLKNQLSRAAVSVMANIAEGFGRKTNKDFSHFLYMAKSSAYEVMSHLYVAMDHGANHSHCGAEEEVHKYLDQKSLFLVYGKAFS